MKTGEEWTSVGLGWTTWVALVFLGFCYLLKLAIQRLRPSPVPASPEKLSPTSTCSEAGSVVASSDESMVSADSQQKSSVNITNEELQYFMEVLGENGNGDEQAWEEVLEKKSDTVAYSAKRRDPKDGGATEYLSVTVFENCSTKLLRDFYMDSDFRAGWDRTLIHHRQLEVCQVTGTEVGHMIKKFPMMMGREYVLAWRIWEGDDQSYYCVLKACEHPDAPRQSNYKRVDTYVSGWRIRKVPGRDACEVKMVHQEDMGMHREMAKMAFRRGIWSFIQKMDLHLRQYAKHQSHFDQGVNAVSLAHKVPLAMKETFPTNELVPEVVEQIVTQASTSGRPVSKSQSKRRLARGLLLLGGALFFTQGSASLGAKIAAVCIVNRAIRPHGSSTNVFQRVAGRF